MADQNTVSQPAVVPNSGAMPVPEYNMGADMSGVGGYQGYIEGVQLNGGPDEAGWNFGQDFAGLEQSQAIPMTNQDFGVLEGMNASFDGDDSIGGRVIGRAGSNTDMVQPGDIMAVFSQVSSNGGENSHVPSGPVSGYDSLAGIPLGPGSGPYTGGEQNTYSVSDGNMEH